MNVWVQYGSKVGFGVRKYYFNNAKKLVGQHHINIFIVRKECVKQDKRYSLSKNPRLETRTYCKVRLGLTYGNDMYKLNEFIEEHNHPLHHHETIHMLSF